MFAVSERSSDAFFTVLATAGTPNRARLGLAISKKQVRRAVDRNRLKRLVRETFRRRRRELIGQDFVVMARAAAVSAGNDRLQQSLARHFNALSS